jgi:protein-S-isoprenylcysteine O-methyltransferase Ste14
MSEKFAATIARARVPLGFVCAVAVLWLARPTVQSLTIGAIAAAAGEAIRIWAAGHLEKGSEVTQSGPYRMTRHPLYVGSGIIAAGAAIASARGIVALVIGLYIVVTIGAAIRHEEANMRAAFGERYDAYARSGATPVERSFSLSRAMKNKEYKAVAGLVAVATILAMKVAFYR